MASVASSNDSSLAAVTDPFFKMLPSIRRSADRAFSHLRIEAREEMIAEVIVIAFKAYRRLIERDKSELAFPSALARYAIRHVRHGRSLAHRLNIHDITSRYCLRLRPVRVQSLNRPSTSRCWQELIVEDRRWTPADIASFRLDFADWLARLTRHQRSIALRLAVGELPSDVAGSLGLSGGRIIQVRRWLRRSWNQLQGLPTAPRPV